MSGILQNKSHFTVNLISNASMCYYPSNKLSSFRTLLPTEKGLDLEGDWEVALSEMVFPTMMKNITDGGIFKFVNSSRDTPIPTLEIGNGLYRSIDEIMDAMFKKLDPYFTQKELWEYHIDEHTQILTITLANETSHLEIISNDIASIFGFPNGKRLTSRGPHIAEYPVDIQRVYSMFVYTDIIEPQILGDRMAPVLRAIPIYSALRKQYGREQMYCSKTQIVKSFDHLEFKRVTNNCMNSILIELHTENGQFTQFFDIGRVSLTLIFRKSR